MLVNFSIMSMTIRMFIIAVTLTGVIISLNSHAMAAGGNDYSSTSNTPAVINKASKLIKNNDFSEAYRILSEKENQYKTNADLYNLMGYSARKIGRFEDSMRHYKQALDIDPKHKGALEYMGELYLTLDQPDEAKKLLVRLEKICSFGCEERRELKEAIAKWEAEH